MKGNFSSSFVERVELASLEWRAGSAREKFRSIVYGLALAQRGCNKKGLKKLRDWVVVTVSAHMVASWYHDSLSQIKFRQLLVKYGIIVKDGSWMSATFAQNYASQPYSNSWHITEPDFKGGKAEVDFSDSYGLFGIYKKAIDKAEGKPVDDSHTFRGKWAIESYCKGKLPWSDFIEVGKAASAILRGNGKKEVSCRVFDAVALCKKELREKCFVDGQGNGMHEVVDIHGAATFTAPLAMAAFGLTSFSDKDVVNWATDLAVGAPIDPYKRVWKAIYDIDPHTNAYGVERKFTKSIRKTVKMDVQCVANCDTKYLLEGKKAYHDFFNDTHVKQNLRRQWLIWNAIRKCNKPLADAILRTKTSGLQDAFYRLHTFGEKMVMGVVIKALKEKGIVVHRVHDALWTSDKRLTSLTEKEVGALVGKIMLRFFNDCKNGYAKKGILKMVKEAGISRAEAEWVWEGIKVSPTVK